MRRLLTAIASIALVSTFFALPANAASPITGSNSPTALAGETNGKLPSTDLINIGPNCVAYRGAAPSLAALLRYAHLKGVTLTTNECYRPLAGQVAESTAWTNAGNSACAAAPAKTAGGAVVGTSMHGWGKAVDFGFGGGEFGSAGYNFLKANAGAFGWNHPAWAEPGGSSCPEAWHWEWVGDGGTAHADTVRADVVGLLPSADDNGYATVTGLGALNRVGDAVDHGNASALPLNWTMVGAAPTADRGGYWMVGADGGIFSYGDAGFYGSTGNVRLNQPVVGMAATPSGHGYWMVAADGGVFSYGDAAFYGSTGAMRLNKPVVGMASTPSGHGYWLVASDGGIFSFGDANFYGSTGAMRLNQPVVGMTASASGHGYRLVATDGGIFSFGDATFYGSTGASPPAQPVVSIAKTLTGNGYWITSASGEITGFGDAPALGNG